MDKGNQFSYQASRHSRGVTLLSANMSDFTYDRHAHEEYSFGVTLKGRQDFFCRTAFHKSPPGGVMVFNPDDAHDGQSGGNENLEYLMLYVHPCELEAHFRSLGVDQMSAARVPETLIEDATLRYQLLASSGLLANQGNVTAIDHDATLLAIAQSVVRLAGNLQQPDGFTRRKDSLLLQAKAFIQEYCHQDITVDDISAAANMSKYHFIRNFRGQFGMTPHQFVLNCRVNRAKRSLELGHSSTLAAQESGFADSSHFIRRFKRMMGMTPKQYQLQLHA
ncbi:AraC family transcriptional regulator [Vibrio sonorensis]|uniref:AraC family transcriptional regulator n=1 Tax=Vibrio sonorensis TaxID=1004316 RepID=UPI0008DB2899|nr:AraC family transcriptional regulator [Vibrio sonorensis]